MTGQQLADWEREPCKACAKCGKPVRAPERFTSFTEHKCWHHHCRPVVTVRVG